tara:strand:- start:4123 stop:4350 length:228 start_codon:yes stop_codon:yes gene_type:complete
MIIELLLMNGYGIYVWSAFIFTLLSFLSLYLIVKIQHTKEKKKFIAKFGTLNLEKASFAKSQSAIREILSNSSYI